MEEKELAFYIKREQFPEYFNGWNEWGPCWIDSINHSVIVSEHQLIRFVKDISKKHKGITILVVDNE